MASTHVLLAALLLSILPLASCSNTTTASGLPFLSHQFDNRADARCQRGFRSQTGGRACCARGCRQCGGAGCSQPLGAGSCCVSNIQRSGRRCGSVGAPCIASTSFRRPSAPDARCSAGITARGICCPEQCRFCGGPTCDRRTPPGFPERACCINFWFRLRRFCDAVGAPCRLERPSGRWVDVTTSIRGRPRARHEACMGWVDGKGYLIGGRGDRPTDIFDPADGSWTQGASVGTELHHMQCVGWGGRIWIASAWTGGFPFEREVSQMYVYDAARDRWSTRPGLPSRRRRGGAAQVLFDDKIFVIGGNRGGHGAHATTLGWVDMYDLVRQEWVTDLPDLAEGRDHFQGAVVNDEMICVSGGRDGGVANFFTRTITSTFCYTPTGRRTGTWRNMRARLPGRGRGGTTATSTCEGEMMVVGGERLAGAASNEVDLFDGVKWKTGRLINRGRHGGGLVTSNCATCGKIYAVSGSGNRGGGPELDSTEMYLPDGQDFECTEF